MHPQVFWHILTRLSYYRELHLRSAQLAVEAGADLTGLGMGIAPAHGSAASMQPASARERDATQQQQQGGGGVGGQGGDGVVQAPVSELDSFALRLNAILASDPTPVCSIFLE